MTETAGDGPDYSTLFGRVLKDGERFAKARLKLYRALAYYRFGQARGPLLLLLIAGAFAIGATVSLLVGLVIWLSAMIGGLGAGIAIFVVGLAIAVLCGWIGMRTMPDLTELPFEDDDIIRDSNDLVEQQSVEAGEPAAL